jgi:hypothetical protein
LVEKNGSNSRSQFRLELSRMRPLTFGNVAQFAGA